MVVKQVNKLSDSTTTINLHVDEAVRALQFEDLTRQLNEDFKKGFDCVQSIVSTMLISSNDIKHDYGCSFKCLNEKNEGLKNILSATAELKSLNIASRVRQESVSEGEVELF